MVKCGGPSPLPCGPGRGALGGRHGVSLPLLSLVPHWLFCVPLRGQGPSGPVIAAVPRQSPGHAAGEINISETSIKNRSIHISFPWASLSDTRVAVSPL